MATGAGCVFFVEGGERAERGGNFWCFGAGIQNLKSN